MNLNPIQDAGALRWIRDELNETLRAAQRDLEAFAEGDGDKAHMASCRDHLHQVRGTLEMVQVHGAAMLAEEMEQVAEALAKQEHAEPAAAAESLMLGLVQLPNYLARLEDGEGDVPLMLLPVFNDLRAARQARPVTEMSMFAPRLGSMIAAEPVALGSGNPELSGELRRRRGQFQRALLGWYQHPQSPERLEEIRALLEEVRELAYTDRMRRLLDAANAIVIDIVESATEPDTTERLLFGRIDRFFKQVIDVGEEAAVREFPIDLLRDLLYYAARSESDHPVVRAVRESAVAANAVPEVDAEGRSRSVDKAANRDLFDAVSEALRHDLREIKDDLDLYMRGNRADLTRLLGLTEPLGRIGDTLGVIGSGELRNKLKSRGEEIRAIGESGAPPEDDVLMAIAGDILLVESALAGLANPDEACGKEDDDGVGLSAEEMHQHLSSAYGEAFSELARAKECFSEFLKVSDNTAALATAPTHLEQVGGVLLVLDQEGAAELLARLGPYLREVAEGRADMPGEAERDAVADIITGVEFYLEAALEQRANRADILDYARAAAQRLGLMPEQSEELVEPEAESPATLANEAATLTPEEMPVSFAETQPEGPAAASEEPIAPPIATSVSDSAQSTNAPEASTQEQPLQGASAACAIGEAAAAEAPTLSAPPEDIDEEILEVFLEEAREELAVIQEQYPRWRADTSEAQALQTFRRSFHTLKGSGRLVGASTIGEFAWAIENLLNRLLDGTIDANGNVLEVMDRACALLPGLIEAQGGGATPDTAAVTAVAERAHRLADSGGETTTTAKATVAKDTLQVAGDEVAVETGDTAIEVTDADAGSTEPAAHEEQPGLAQAEPPIVLEPTLHEIFRNEADTHLEHLRGFLARCEQNADVMRFDADLERTLHTLHGSAHMAEIHPIAGLAGELERFVSVRRQLGGSVDEEGRDLLARGAEALHGLVGVINEAGAELPAWEALAEEVRTRRERLEMQLLEAPEKSEISEEIDLEVGEEPAVPDVVDASGPADAAPASVPPPPTPTATPSAEVTHQAFDPELLEIFLEEAKELAERMDSEFQAWLEAPHDRAPVADLQRTLHTFKGGARLAGITALGDLSHALESLFEAVVEGTTEVTPELQRIARRGVDHLASAVEQLHVDGTVAAPTTLVGRIEAALRGEFGEGASHLVEVEEARDESPGAESEAAVTPAPTEEPGPADTPAVEADEAAVVEAQAAEAPVPADVPETATDPAQVIPFPHPAGGAAAMPADDDAPALERPAVEPAPREERRASERVRVSSDLLDQLVNGAGEVSIYRARLEQQNNSLDFNLQELDQTVTRLREQLRQLEIETETQILSRHENDPNVDFDPLELDRYSTIQELSRALSETVSDLSNIGTALQDLNRDTETLLLQHTRVTNELQDGLLRTRMIPFGSRVPRLQRVVRQTAETLGKQAELVVEGEQGEIDRTILESVVAPLEHLLRNAVAHGIETPQGRTEAGKPEMGRIELKVTREGTEVAIRISDDGRGLDREAIRRKAIERGLLDPEASVSESDLDAYIFTPGFSTSAEVSQISGRGVGMDVVQSEVKQLGGSAEVRSAPGKGVIFTIRLPFTLAISEGLLVQQGDDVYAVPHGTVDGVTRVAREELEACYAGERETIEYAGISYQVRYLGTMLGVGNPLLVEGQKWYPVLLVRTGDHRVAVQVDELLGNRQVVVKSVGPQLANIRWFTGATILADGKVALILDVNSLVRMEIAKQVAPPVQASAPEAAQVVTVMVVDDSITVRKVTTRLLERHNMQVVTAKDGVDAVAKLQDTRPDVMLLDIEMPRMDGFELARHLQNTPELSDIPIVMITSRTGDKHRSRAMELGVKRYLGKPYQESDLLENIYAVLGEREA